MLVIREFSKKKSSKEEDFKLQDKVANWTTKNLVPRKLRKSYYDWAGSEKHKGRGMSATSALVGGATVGALTKNPYAAGAAALGTYGADRLTRRVRNKWGSANNPVYLKERDRIDMIEGRMKESDFKKKWKH